LDTTSPRSGPAGSRSRTSCPATPSS
jgi:hypothetical protein